MDEVFKDPVHFSKGINLKTLMTSSTEFHIDIDFQKETDLLGDDDLLAEDDDEEDSDIEDVLKNIEESTEKLMLSSPDYLSFKELATKNGGLRAQWRLQDSYFGGGNRPRGASRCGSHRPLRCILGKSEDTLRLYYDYECGFTHEYPSWHWKCLPGLEIGLTTVRGPTARFILLLQPRLAWGPNGVPPRILPQPALFVISLYNVKDVYSASKFNDLPIEEQTKFEVTMKTVAVLHSQAKDLFGKKKYYKAIKNYQQSRSVLCLSMPRDKNEEEEIKKLTIKVYTNLAICYCKINKPKYVFLMCDNLDRISNLDNHCKALFYCGQAHEMLGKQELAAKYYKKALKLEPKNRDIGKALASLDESVKTGEKNVKELWQNAFQSPAEKGEGCL
ncbi:hypothetical protein ACJJTC_011300 [Scirpophaga incertulas]